jgi:hypothetical protein
VTIPVPTDPRTSVTDLSPTTDARSTPDPDRTSRRLGVVAAVLLGLATVATAWSAYQANRWNGVMTSNFNESVRLSTDAGKLYQEGDAINTLDANLFAEWALATTADNAEAADYLAENLFSEGLIDALEAWQAAGADAPPSPFDLDEYVVPQWDAGDALEIESQAATDLADDANQTGDDYVLVTVLLAVVLFTAGIAATLESVRLKAAFLVSGGVVFVVAAGLLLTYPVQ